MKIVIADSNELSRIGLRSVLTQLNGVTIVGEADSSDELLKISEKSGFDQLIIDYTSENFSIDVVPKVLHRQPDVDVIAITPEQST